MRSRSRPCRRWDSTSASQYLTIPLPLSLYPSLFLSTPLFLLLSVHSRWGCFDRHMTRLRGCWEACDEVQGAFIKKIYAEYALYLNFWPTSSSVYLSHFLAFSPHTIPPSSLHLFPSLSHFPSQCLFSLIYVHSFFKVSLSLALVSGVKTE